MGEIKSIKTKIAHDIKIVDPTPVWEVTLKQENKPPLKLYVGPKKAEQYMKAGHQIKLKTTPGELRQYD